MKKLRNNKIRKLLAFMVALALMVSCMPSAYTISASEAFGDGTEDIFTDGEITSEPAAEESTPDVSSADQEETEQAQQSTLTYENDSVKVTAEALEDGALPQNTALKADGVNENSSVSYDTVSQKLSAAATDKGSSLRGFFAYDVYFADGDGNRVEPNGRVRVTFEYKTPAAPELTDAASTSVTVEKLHYNNSTGDTDVNTLQANEDLKVLNVNEGKQIQTLQVETGNAAVFAVMWDSPETPAAENPEVTPEAEPSEEPAENPDAEPTEAPAENPDVVEEPAEDIASPDEVPAADENGETSLIEVLGDDTNLRVSPSIEAEVLATVNAGTQLTLLDTVTAEDGATWYKVSWEGTEAYIRSDMAQVVDSSDEAEEPEDVQEEEIQPEITRYDYKSDEVNVKVTLTNPADLPDNAELSVTPVELSQKAEDQITEEAIKEKKAIEKIHAYDIKFLVDGEEIQPGASVKVSVSLNDERKIKDADVYHVDAEDNVENMDGSVDKNGNVEFETTHFSTYVIVQRGGENVKVIIRHLDNTTSKTATVNDWDKRTYDINITAASTSTSTITTTEKAVADIMLVLDVSGSMDKTTVSYSYVAENTTDGRAGLNTGTLYYVKKDESYVKLQYYNNYYGRTGWYIGDDWWSQTKADDSTYNGWKIYLKKTEKKLTALQNAVKQFITDTANKSPDSKIGITAFSSAGYGSHGKTEDLQKAGDNKENLTRFVDSLVANGGTDPYVGLKNAKSKLDAATMSGDTKPKYVLLFTDGEPTGSGNSWDTTAQQNAENITNGTESIKGIKQEGYTVYTIGFGLRDKAKAFLEGGTYGRTTYPGIASKNCAFNAENATQLGDIFKDIQNTITQDISITGATITDIIDPRFELLKDDGTLYTQDDLNNGVEVNGGTVSLVKGNYQIQWTDQTIPNKKNGEWNKTIKVKAKDNFVGGNNVTTNVSPGSKISTGYGDVELPQPTVNVKVNLVVKDKDVWIYKGDTVPTDETILNQLFNESETSYSKGTISAADAKDHITLQWKDGTQTNISKENMATTPDDDTEYYLEVTYDPKTTSTDESKTNTTTSDGEQHVVGAAEKAYNPDNSNNPYGIYKIHVIKGQIQITKNVTETSDTDRTFTFNVNAKNGQNVSDSQVNVIVPAGETSGTVTLPDLPRGEYTVTEDNADGYFIQAFDIVTGDGQTDCENVKSDADKSLKFTLGNDVKKANVITTDYTYTSGGVKGVASYTNEAVISLDLKKTDTDNHSLTGAKFKLEMKDGDIWKSLENDIEVKNDTSEIELNNLKAGIYKLTETTAPKGYSLLGSSICFKVATGSVTLVDENGDPAQKSNMWSLENKVLTIKNAKLYSLPESGGPGIYGFTISGVAILATALLLFINNKRREEEAKRS